ncbi:hypothetical protein FB451DRAFT_1183214 [Mycena latifolia]|nr:hypothetical protein FB451DRAFT_1183214 [Mycena latifolia]
MHIVQRPASAARPRVERNPSCQHTAEAQSSDIGPPFHLQPWRGRMAAHLLAIDERQGAGETCGPMRTRAAAGVVDADPERQMAGANTATARAACENRTWGAQSHEHLPASSLVPDFQWSVHVCCRRSASCAARGVVRVRQLLLAAQLLIHALLRRRSRGAYLLRAPAAMECAARRALQSRSTSCASRWVACAPRRTARPSSPRSRTGVPIRPAATHRALKVAPVHPRQTSRVISLSGGTEKKIFY